MRPLSIFVIGSRTVEQGDLKTAQVDAAELSQRGDRRQIVNYIDPD